ncbi:probable protein phosphatase 2C 55 [Humulus lupulus]|uniref:probable protein phosphatase 2C 55 n=1 Tax=Humulus lupulus TaxID=3486 RepID=UPI002B4103F8|nr:probable protein phosphatase 2C 55 [Humulus lupulus]
MEVANGVGGCAREGVDFGKYECSLMTNSLAAVNKLSETNSQIDSKNIIEEAFCKNNKFEGSSTTCVVTHKSSDGLECTMKVELGVNKGDVVVMGRDGLFDNLFDWEIQQIIKKEHPKLLDSEHNSNDYIND